MSDVQIKGPIYLDSYYENVPLDTSWNKSGVAALRNIADVISKSNTEFHDLEIYE